jgi:hypothetical protein
MGYGIQMLLQVSFIYVIIILPLAILLYKLQYVIFSNLEILKNYKSIRKQDRQSTYNLTLRRVLVTTVAVEKQ